MKGTKDPTVAVDTTPTVLALARLAFFPKPSVLTIRERVALCTIVERGREDGA